MNNLHIIMYYIGKYSCAKFKENTEGADMEEIYKIAESIENDYYNQEQHDYITSYLNNLYSVK